MAISKLRWKKIQHEKKSYTELFSSLEEQSMHVDNELDFLIELTDTIRPKHAKDFVSPSLRPILEFLNAHSSHKELFKKYIKALFFRRRFTHILSDTGIIQDTRFFGEIVDRMVAKLLPEQPEKDTLEYILNQVLYKKTDYLWFQNIPFSEFLELIHLLEIESIYTNVVEYSPIQEVLQSISLLIQRASGRFLEKDVLQMIPAYEYMESPFEAFEKLYDALEIKIRNNGNQFLAPSDLDFCSLLDVHAQCHLTVEEAFSNSKKYGISIRVNQSLLRVQQQLKRIGVLLPLLLVSKESDKLTNSIVLLQTLIRYNCRKNNIVKLIGQSTQTLAYEITQHTAKTGEHYITQSRKQYFNMLYTAMGGGMIVGFLCVFKVLMSKADVSEFGHAVLYSFNYALGFITIYLLGFTLATKQPAMTAAAIVKSIEVGTKKSIAEKDRHLAFAKLFSQLFRSQFIAFVGNVLVAFPVSLFVVWLSVYLFNYNFASEKSETLLRDLSPIHSAAIFHAAIAGVFLFLSGIISGAISNRNKHKRVYYRFAEHPFLKKTIGKQQTRKLAEHIEQKWPGIASNFWFGVFMGSTAIIGVFFGLNLDIRHITFASGNFALGLFGSNFDVSIPTLFWGIVGIGIIGFVNFIVSFLLSLALAFRSRNIQTSEIKYLFKSVWYYFKKKPFSFFIPTK